MELMEKCPVRCKRRGVLFSARKTACAYSRKCSPARNVFSEKWNEGGAARVKECEVAKSGPFLKANQL